MTSELLAVLARVNLAGAAAVALALALRLPVRRLFGARIAYGLWSLAPLAALAMLLPARVVAVTVAPAPQAMVVDFAAQAPPLAAGGPDLGRLALWLWLAGAAASLIHMAWRQVQFARAVRSGLAGPAVVGVLRPRIVTPDDFEQRYSPRERLVVLAHEQAHVARQDSRINALVALARCAFWFNPFVHLLSRFLRVDQELACDAQVVAAHPSARRAYAEAMLKTQLAARPLPLGCYWPAEAAHPLAERIRLLARRPPAAAQQNLGVASLALMGATAACVAWASRPPQIVQIPIAVRAAPVASAAPPLATVGAFAVPPAPVARRLAAAGPITAADVVPPADTLPVDADPAPMPALSLAQTPRERADPDRARRIMTNAQRSSVEPGNAVRVVATTVGPDGTPFWLDLTSFGSQSIYRTGGFGWVEPRDHRMTSFFERGQRHGLFTSVTQHGDRLLVTASLDKRFDPAESATIELRSGETGQLTLPNGQQVAITPTVRPETPEEIAEGEQALQRMAANFDARGGGRFVGR